MTHRELEALVRELKKRVRKLELAGGSRLSRAERDVEEREAQERYDAERRATQGAAQAGT